MRMTVEDICRMIAPAIMRRRIQWGLRWLHNPSGKTNLTDTFLVAHGLLPDEIAPQSALSFVWEEAKQPTPWNFVRNM